MLPGATVIDRLAGCDHADFKPFSFWLTTILLAKLSLEDKLALASLLMLTRFNLVKKDYSLVIRDSEMFARIFVGAVFEQLDFPFSRAQTDVKKLILDSSTDAKAKDKLFNLFRKPNQQIIDLLLPFYCAYVEANSDGKSPRDKKS